jgi:exodeoxyribonuclease VII small subunit
MPKPRASRQKETIEGRLGRLDKIVEKLGEGKASLDQARGLYAEGMGLVKDCRAELKASKGLVEKLNRETGTLEALDPEEPE